MRGLLFSFPFCRWTNWGSKELSYLPEGTRLLREGAGMGLQLQSTLLHTPYRLKKKKKKAKTGDMLYLGSQSWLVLELGQLKAWKSILKIRIGHMCTVCEEGQGKSTYSVASNPVSSSSPSSSSLSKKLLFMENLLCSRSCSKCIISTSPYNAFLFNP